jgi:ABC-type sugar transport system ATPase subunit
MASIRFERVAKRFDGHSVIAPLDLTVADGEFFTFVGPSGCGKSTLLSLLAGVEAPSEGTIYFDGQAVNRLAPGERDVAMVFQSYALYPHLTVRDNIGFPLRVRGLARQRVALEVQRVAEALGLSELLERKPRQLSGGQRQRVALGRALVRQPRVFLMDEPLSNLDARLRLETREEIKRLQERLGITTVYVTHDQEEAMALSQRMAVLRAGHIEQCGAPQAVYEDPVNLFVAQFVGSPPINLLESDALEQFPAASRFLALHPASALVLGVRPADVEVRREPAPGAIEAELAAIEPTGSDWWVVGHWRGQRIKGKAAGSARLERGMRAYFRFAPDRLYAFDRNTGARLRGS